MKLIRFASGIVIFSISALTLSHALPQTQTVNPFIGYWKLSIDRSTMRGTPPPGYFNLRSYEDKGGGWITHNVTEGMSKAGNFLFATVRYDEKEYPVFNSSTLGTFFSAGTKPASTVSFKRLDASTLEYTDRRNGTVTNKGVCTVSAGGKTLTIATTNVDAQGKETGTVSLVYERQTE